MASWTFDEPWPNAAHGCVIDYYGQTKHAPVLHTTFIVFHRVDM